MTFEEILTQVQELLQREGRVAYRILKRRFALNDDDLEDLKADLIDAKRLTVDEEGKVLVWVGASPFQSTEFKVQSSLQHPTVVSSQLPVASPQHPVPSPQSPAERRQLTVMFCDLVGSTALSAQLDPEELREVVRAYQETSTGVIRQYDGHIAQHLGDGLLVYFGYPMAHEDDAARAARAGLEIITALQKKIPSPWKNTAGEILPVPPLLKEGTQKPPLKKGAARSAGGFGGMEAERELHIRIGIHTGLVVIGEIGSSEKREILALGETPNLAARIQGQAAPDEVMISEATYRLVEGLFACEDCGQPELKGVATPLTLYRVLKEEEAQSRFEVVMRRGLTPLVGREHEYGLLLERWARVKEGTGQAVLLSGEPGIGKSRLVEALKETVERDGAACVELRCSPYHQNSALYPVIEHVQRLLHFGPDDSLESKHEKLQQTLYCARFPQADTLPLFAALLSLPHPEGYPPLTLSPQKQKEKTHDAVVAWLCEQAQQQALTYAWEDLHWADPSTLELLTLLLNQVPTTRLLAVLTYRPEFTPPWGAHSYLSQLTLSRLGRSQVETMVEKVTGGKALPVEIIQQIVSKTDGVPLFVEELTKSVVESVGTQHAAPSSQLGIPSTLQDALMARLDRLGGAKEMAQLGAVLGREFNYELLHAVSPLEEDTLQRGLRQLVEAELIYQHGLLPQATYLFKHALIQDTAYQSLLKSTRQKYHQRIAHVLEERFPDTKENQSELLAHHYTEAGLAEQSIPHWQKAGQRVSQRSAHVEAISYLTKGLELLKTLPDTPKRTQQELMLQLALGASLMAIKGYTVPEVEKAYSRALELCQCVGETSQLFPALMGLYRFYAARADHETAHELAEQLLALAHKAQDSTLLMGAHYVMGGLYWLGEFVPALAHQQQAIALYHPQQHRPLAFVYGVDFGMVFSSVAFTLWCLGYAEQALKSSDKAIALAQELSHPHSLASVLHYTAWLHQYRREGPATQKRAEEVIALCHEQGFPFLGAWGTMYRGWALAQQGQVEEGLVQIRQGLAASRATGARIGWPYWLALLAEVYGKAGQVEEGLLLLAEALTIADNTGERFYEAELYRLKGELTLAQSRVLSPESGVQENQNAKVKEQQSKIETEPRPLTPDPQGEAEACFLKAIEIARKQQAKSLELRAVMSLARLWQQQSKRHEAHTMLSDIYHWFTEGFDTKDLQEAKTLLDSLASKV